MANKEELSVLGGLFDNDGNAIETGPRVPSSPSISVGEFVKSVEPGTEAAADPTAGKVVTLPDGAEFEQPKPSFSLKFDNLDPAPVPDPAAPPPVPTSVMTIMEVSGLVGYGSGVIAPHVPDGGELIKEWTGDPDEEVLPGQFVYYWLPGNRPGLLQPHLCVILGRTDAGAYSGARLRGIQGGHYAMSAARPSRIPKRGFFTRRARFNVSDCTEKEE